MKEPANEKPYPFSAYQRGILMLVMALEDMIASDESKRVHATRLLEKLKSRPDFVGVPDGDYGLRLGDKEAVKEAEKIFTSLEKELLKSRETLSQIIPQKDLMKQQKQDTSPVQPASNGTQQTVSFLGEGGKVNVFPVVKDYGIYRVLGPTLECEGKHPEPKVGTRLPPMPLSRHKGRELAVVICQLFGDDKCSFFIDYAQKDRKRARKAIIKSNANMGRPRGLKACAEEVMKENETSPLNLRIYTHNGEMEILGLAEEEKARLGEARFNELELIIAEMELYGGKSEECDPGDDAEAWKNA
jgi:hypothetical protein